jgi:hypothetical protein
LSGDERQHINRRGLRLLFHGGLWVRAPFRRFAHRSTRLPLRRLSFPTVVVLKVAPAEKTHWARSLPYGSVKEASGHAGRLRSVRGHIYDTYLGRVYVSANSSFTMHRTARLGANAYFDRAIGALLESPGMVGGYFRRQFSSGNRGFFLRVKWQSY